MGEDGSGDVTATAILNICNQASSGAGPGCGEQDWGWNPSGCNTSDNPECGPTGTYSANPGASGDAWESTIRELEQASSGVEPLVYVTSSDGPSGTDGWEPLATVEGWILNASKWYHSWSDSWVNNGWACSSTARMP